MKLIHISDLHIGKKVNNFSMIENQKHILKQILKIIKEESPAAVMISGDIYDKMNPSEEAVRCMDEFLVQLSEITIEERAGCPSIDRAEIPEGCLTLRTSGFQATGSEESQTGEQAESQTEHQTESSAKGFVRNQVRHSPEVFVLSGNHDSAERIAFASRLIDSTGIHMCPVFRGETYRYSLEDEYGTVNIYMLPYIKPVHVRRFFPEENPETASEAVRTAIEKMNINENERNVIMSHQFVTGSVTCDTELNVGGLDEVSAKCYEAFDYAALGHIHSAQDVIKNKIRYCGTPLKYSFAESGQIKSLTIVEIKEKGNVKVSEKELTPLFDFIRIEGSFAEIMNEYRERVINDYAEVTLTDETDIPDAFRRLEVIFPNLMQLKYNNKRTRAKKEIGFVPESSEISEMDMVEQFYELQNNQPLTEVQKEYLNKIINSVQEVTL